MSGWTQNRSAHSQRPIRGAGDCETRCRKKPADGNLSFRRQSRPLRHICRELADALADPVLHGVAALAHGNYHVRDSQAVSHLLGCSARSSQFTGEIRGSEPLG